MQLTSILLDEETFTNYEAINEAENALNNLSKINIFIGANNSGKSRLMRFLFTNQKLSFTRKEVNTDKLLKMIRVYHDEIVSIIQKFDTRKITIPKLLEFEHINYINLEYNFEEEIKSILQQYFYNSNFNIKVGPVDGHYDINRNQDATNLQQRTLKNIKDLISNLKSYNTKFEQLYIPILRGLRPIQSLGGGEFPDNFNNSNEYLFRTIKDYFPKHEDKNKLFISTGLDFYQTVKNLKAGDDHEHELIEGFEKFLSNTFFQGQSIRITAHIKKDVVTFKIGKDESRPIYELGDGIQAIILLIYPLFFNQGKEMIFFFEEPETHLHPGFQRIFIETLQRPEFESFQYFISTHSNHFLDITLDQNNISIYNFRKSTRENGKFEIENVKSGDNNVLQDIGVRNASVFLSNCTIWVEGISDRIYIRKYLEVYMKKVAKERSKENEVLYREDYHYSFVEYSGNNITHWSFLDDDDSEHPNINVDRICKRLFVVTDHDGAGETKDGQKVEKAFKINRHEKLKNKLGEDHYHRLDCREIENALSPNILKKVIESRKKGDEIINFKNWKYENYQHTKLGDFIEKNVVGNFKKINDGGTIYDKPEFSKAAYSAIESFDDLSEPAKELTKKLFAFIERYNS